MRQKLSSDYLLFYVCDTEQEGNPISAYGIVEAVMHLYDQPKVTVVVFDLKGLGGHVAEGAYKIGEGTCGARFPEGHIFSNADEAIAFFCGQDRREIS